MRIQSWHLCTIALITSLSAAGAVRAGPLKVVDVIPFADSSEAQQNAEPSLGVNPVDPSQLIAGAFSFSNTIVVSYFKSTAGGTTWSDFGILNIFDKSIAWKQDGSAALTAGGTDADIRTFSGTTAASNFGSAINTFPADGNDQPWIRTGPSDHVYVGFNAKIPNPNSATVNVSTNGGLDYQALPIDRVGATAGPLGPQDAPEVRLAVNGSTVYSVFTRYKTEVEDTFFGARFGSEVVVVRSDNGGADGFTALGTDGNGVTAATTTSVFGLRPPTTLTLGEQRIGGDVAIAVDPKDKDHIVVAYGDAPGPDGSNLMKLVVTESFNGGASWTRKFETTSTLQIRQGLPSLAILDNGVSYGQKLVTA
jgi:hypothetical protein